MTDTSLSEDLNIDLNEDLDKNEKINKMLQNIFHNLQELKTKMIVNKSKNKDLFQVGTEIIKQSITPNTNININIDNQSTSLPSSPIISNKNNNNVSLENNNNVNIENMENKIKEQQDEINNLKEKLQLISLEKDNKYELNQLSTQIDQLQKVIFILEKKNRSTESSYSDIKSSLETLIEKGRLQMKSLLHERSKSEQYFKQFNQERDITTQLRNENLQLKTKVQEMLFLLQKASEEEEDYYQAYSNEAYLENQLLREMLGISNKIKNLKSNDSSNNIDQPKTEINGNGHINNSEEEEDTNKEE